MGAALKVAGREAEVAEEAGDAADVDVLAMMGGAGERKLLVRQRELFEGARADHGEGLHRLDGGAREDRAGDIAG